MPRGGKIAPIRAKLSWNGRIRAAASPALCPVFDMPIFILDRKAMAGSHPSHRREPPAGPHVAWPPDSQYRSLDLRALSILSAIAILVSLFLSWTGPALPIPAVTPWDLISALKPDVEALRSFIASSPGELVAFLATFALAAVFLVLVLFNLPSRLIGLLGGGLGVGLTGWTVWKISKGASDLPVPANLDIGKANDIVRAVTDLAGPGAWAWFAGSALLLLAALIGWDRR